MKKLPPLLLASSLTLLTSCGHVVTKSETYDTSQTVTINGAKVATGVKPVGGKNGMALSAMVYMAGSASLEGPFRWRIQAEGLKGKHTHMTVHRLKVETSKTRRKEWFPSKKLGWRKDFEPYKKEAGKVFAVYQVPGKLAVDPKKDGDITILADVSISTKQKTVRKLVKFKLGATSGKRDVDFIFFPSEIAKSFSEKDPENGSGRKRWMIFNQLSYFSLPS